ncbi:MAG: hypothetical protein WCF24_01605 [Acidimicrobiales bacterium]
MIVRILEDGQYEVADQATDGLNEIDQRLAKAIDAGDDAAFNAELDALIDAVHRSGTRLDATDLRPSDLAVPAAGSTLAEVKALLSQDGMNRD